MLVSKPIIAPAILFYYVQENRKKTSWSYIIIVSFFFIGDMLVLLEIENALFVIVSIFLIAYILFLKDISDDLLRSRLKIIHKKNLLVLLICIFLLIYLLVTVLDLMIESHMKNLVLFLFYGIVLVLIGGISSFNYVLKQTRFTFFMLIASLCFVISDVFFILKSHFQEVEIFNLFNNLPQVLSYYYLTKYYILRPGLKKN